MQILCINDFSYPTLTEGKTYEAKFDRSKLFVIDDTGLLRDFPESHFYMNGFEDNEILLRDLEQELGEVEDDIEEKEDRKTDLEDEIDNLENEINYLESQKTKLEGQIKELRKKTDNY